MTLELHGARCIATVYDEGMILDQFRAESREAAVQAALAVYPDATLASPTYTQPGSVLGNLDATILEIIQEIELDRQAGRVVPFVEGTPIGMIPTEHRADLRMENGRGGKLKKGWRPYAKSPRTARRAS